jgi:hypothetical protein
MPIDVNPSLPEIDELHDDLKAYEVLLAAYLASPAGQGDPNYVPLAKADIQLNLQIYNLSVAGLNIAAANAGQAVDAINSATAALNKVVQQKAKIATDLKIVQAAVSFVTAIVSVNPSQIISTGGSLVSTLNAA